MCVRIHSTSLQSKRKKTLTVTGTLIAKCTLCQCQRKIIFQTTSIHPSLFVCMSGQSTRCMFSSPYRPRETWFTQRIGNSDGKRAILVTTQSCSRRTKKRQRRPPMSDCDACGTNSPQMNIKMRQRNWTRITPN